MVLWTTFFSLQFQANFLVGEKNLPGSGSGSGLRFLAGSGFNEYRSKTLGETDNYLNRGNEKRTPIWIGETDYNVNLGKPTTI